MAGLLTLAAGCGKTVAGDATPAAVIPVITPTASSPVTSSPASSTPMPLPTTTGQSATGESAGTAAGSPAVSSTTPSTTISFQLPTPIKGAPKKNKYGNNLASVGHTYGVTWSKNNQVAVEFVVESAEVDGACDDPAKPVNGHFLILTIKAQLGYASGQELSDAGIGFASSYWTAFDAKANAEVDIDSDAAGDCLTESLFPYIADNVAGDVVTGKIALDVSSAKGTAVILNNIDGGWVYDYG